MIQVFESLIPDSLLKKIQQKLVKANFVDGLRTAGKVDESIKRNLQLPVRDPLAREISGDLVRCLGQHADFVIATLVDKRVQVPHGNLRSRILKLF